MNQKKLYKNVIDKKICGVCSGLADYFEIDVTLIRLITALVIILGNFPALILYFVAAIIMPVNPDQNR